MEAAEECAGENDRDSLRATDGRQPRQEEPSKQDFLVQPDEQRERDDPQGGHLRHHAQELGSLGHEPVDVEAGRGEVGEEVTGGTSLGRITLDGTTPMDGAVDVTIENASYGSRDGNALTGGFDYTA